MVIALGVAWMLDGLEITIAANVVADLTQKSTLNLTAVQAAGIATWYLVGEVIGALFHWPAGGRVEPTGELSVGAFGQYEAGEAQDRAWVLAWGPPDVDGAIALVAGDDEPVVVGEDDAGERRIGQVPGRYHETPADL